MVKTKKTHDYDSLPASLKSDMKDGVFFVTAAVAAAPVHKLALQAVNKYLTKRKGKLIVLGMRHHAKSFEKQIPSYDPELNRLIKDGKVAKAWIFNDNLHAIDAQINPQAIQPLTGMSSLGVRRNGSMRSVIIAHTKQDMQTIAVGRNKHPRIIKCTGAITLPNYQHNRIGILAKRQHVCGGLIIEVRNSKIFHPREVQFLDDGSFIDLAIRYYPDGSTERVKNCTMILGDIHLGEHSRHLEQILTEQYKQIQPTKIFYHDLVSGNSISHHMQDDIIARSTISYPFQNLTQELMHAQITFEKLRNLAPDRCKHYVVASNHLEFTSRWLKKGTFASDPQNFRLGCQMAILKLDGKSELQPYVDPDKKAIWLGRNEDVIIAGTQLAAHGDDGANGSKGSLQGFTQTYGRSITGHTHVAGIRGGAWSVATQSEKRLGYNNGPSAWVNANAVLYPCGSRQLLINIDLEWRL